MSVAKALLFGAGQGARHFLTNNEFAYEYIGIIDNDAKKCGTEVESLKVYSPKHIHSLDFDFIIITTQWGRDVASQLVNEEGVAKEQVILPEKNQLKPSKPFYCEKTRTLAGKIIKKISALAMKHNVHLVVDFGTLLGLVRDGDVIEWDDDVDISALAEDALDVERLLQQFVSEWTENEPKFYLEKIVNKQDVVTGFLLKFREENGAFEKFNTSVCLRKEIKGISKHLPSLGMFYSPAKHFQSFQTIDWQEQKIPVPYEYEDYLDYVYGNWKTPKKNIQLTDYEHLNDVTFEDFQNASLKTEAIGKHSD
ncbi:MAG: LicD family protein [Aestuariibacter sp.]